MPNSTCLNLFAYATLMDRDELAFRLALPPSEVARRLRTKVAEAIGFRRVFNKQVAEEGGAVLNLEFDKAGTVVGILYMDITHQELGMLDASYPHHLPRKPLEVLVEGEKVAALAYMAKADAGVEVAAAYEQRVLEVVRRLGEPILANFLHHTYRADGSPCYRPADPVAPTAPAPVPPASAPAGA